MERRGFLKRLLVGLGVAAGVVPAPAAQVAARVQACADLPDCATPADALRTARQIARFVLGLDPPGRLAGMKQLAAGNPAMHALVRDEIAGMRAAAWRRKEDGDAAA